MSKPLINKEKLLKLSSGIMGEDAAKASFPDTINGVTLEGKTAPSNLGYAATLSAGNFSINKELADKYRKYGVIPNAEDSEEELNRERAENQSVLEQAGRSLGRMIWSEAILGTLRGFGDIYDAIATRNFFKPSYEQTDYTNPWSEFFENAQNAANERMEIYRKDPNATWALDDFGWWADNAVSVASTLSLLIPAKGITSGISFIGKALKYAKTAGKVSKAKTVGDVLRGINKSEHIWDAGVRGALGANKYSKYAKLSAATDAGTTALVSRIGENYIEARDTYNNVHKTVLDTFNNFTESEREQFIKNNPDFADKTDEEIADYIAGESASRTYRNDFAMLLMDIAQFKAISGAWKHLPNRASNIAIRKANAKAALTVVTNEAVDKGEKQVAKSLGKRIFSEERKAALRGGLKGDKLWNRVEALEIGEGFEEMYQGITAKSSEDVANKYLDPNYTDKDILSYLNDNEIWEQGFWGMLGGIAFQGAGKGLNKLSTWLYTKANKDLSEEDIKTLLRGENARRIAEIEGRKSKIDNFVTKIKLVNEEGKNPFKPIKNGENIEYEDIENPEEKERLTNILLGGLAEELTFTAIENGNYDLFKEWVSQSSINEYIKQEGGDVNIDLENRLLNDMDSIAKNYSETYEQLMESADVVNPYAAQLAVRQIIRRNRQVNDMQDSIDRQRSKLNNLAEIHAEGVDIENDINQQIYNQILFELEQLDARASGLQQLYDSKKPNNKGVVLSKSGLYANLKEINATKKAIAQYISSNTPFISNERFSQLIAAGKFNQALDVFKDHNSINSELLKNYTESTQNLIKEIAATELYKDVAQRTTPYSKEDYAQIYENLESALYDTANTRFNDAYNKAKQYIESSNNYEQALSEFLSEELEDEDLKEAAKILKLGYGSRENLTKDFINDINNLKKKDSAEAEKVNAEERSGEEVPSEIEPAIPIKTPKEEPKNPNEAAAGVSGVQEEEINSDDPALEKAAAAEAVAMLQRLSTINTSDIEKARTSAVEAAEQIIRTRPKDFYNLINGSSVDFTLDYNNFLNLIAAELVNSFNTDQTLANLVAEYGLKVFLSTPRAKSSFAKRPQALKHVVDFLNQIKEISTNVDWSQGFDAINGIYDPSKIRAFTEEEFYNKFIDLLNTYTELQQNIYSKDGKSYINLYDVAQYLMQLADEDDINYETVVQAITNLKIFAKNYKGSEFILEGKSFITKNAEAIIDDIYQRLTTYETVSDKLHFDVHKTTDATSTTKQKSTIQKFKEFRSKNKELKIEYRRNSKTNEPISVSLYYEDDNGGKQEIGYLDLIDDVSEGKQNTAYKRNKGIGFRYSVSLRGTEYEMAPAIDNLFKQIIKGANKNATNEQKELYELFRNYFILNNPKEFDTVKNSKEYSINDNVKIKFLNSNLFIDLLKSSSYGIPIRERKYVPAAQKEMFITTGYYTAEQFNKLSNDKKLDITQNFFNDVANVIFYELKSYTSKENSANNLGESVMIDSYNNFVEKVFENYKSTYLLQVKLDEAGKNGITNLSIKYNSDNAARLNYSENGAERGTQGLIPIKDVKEHPYVFVYGNTLYDEYGHSYNTPTWMGNGTSGILMYDNGNPFIAMFTGANVVSETNMELANALHSYFGEAIDRYFNAVGKDAETEYENLYNTFESLIGRQRLFKGFEIEKLPSSDAFALKYVDDKGTKHTFATFFKYSGDIIWKEDHYETADGKRVANKDKHIYAKPALSIIINKKRRNVYNNKTDETKKELTKFLNVLLTGHKMRTASGINEIFKGLQYNSDASIAKYYMGSAVQGVNPSILKRNAKINNYVSKKNGKLVIKIGNFEASYDNYAHFLIANNAMLTTHSGRTNKTINEYQTAPTSVYVDIDSVQTPVKEMDNELIKKGLSKYVKEKFPNGKGQMNVDDVLKSTGVSQAEIDSYRKLSEVVGKKYQFIPDTVEIDITTKTSDDGGYYPKDSKSPYKGKIVLFKSGIELANNKDRINILRLLVHEQMHKVVDINNFFDGEVGEQRAAVIDDIWNQLYKHTRTLDTDDWLRKFANQFNRYWKNVSAKERANEFIAEIMSQPGLIDRLNDIEYKGKYVINNTKESLFQKLLRTIMKLFGNDVDTINENTILDNINKILGDDISISITAPSKVGKKVKKIETVPAEEKETETGEITKEEELDATKQGQASLPENKEEDEDEEDDDDNDGFKFTKKKRDIYDRNSSKIRNYTPIEIAIDDVNKDGTNNPNGLVFVPNMEEFLNRFPVNERAAIRAELTAGRITYVCQ